MQGTNRACGRACRRVLEENNEGGETKEQKGKQKEQGRKQRRERRERGMGRRGGKPWKHDALQALTGFMGEAEEDNIAS